MHPLFAPDNGHELILPSRLPLSSSSCDGRPIPTYLPHYRSTADAPTLNPAQTDNMETLNPSDLVTRLASDEDAVRKMAAFKLQGSIGDPSFADIFIAEGGLSKLRYLTLTTTGNTLAYSLTSFARLLEVDKGWEFVDEEVVERVFFFPPSSTIGQIEAC